METFQFVQVFLLQGLGLLSSRVGWIRHRTGITLPLRGGLFVLSPYFLECVLAFDVMLMYLMMSWLQPVEACTELRRVKNCKLFHFIYSVIFNCYIGGLSTSSRILCLRLLPGHMQTKV